MFFVMKIGSSGLTDRLDPCIDSRNTPHKKVTGNFTDNKFRASVLTIHDL